MLGAGVSGKTDASSRGTGPSVRLMWSDTWAVWCGSTGGTEALRQFDIEIP